MKPYGLIADCHLHGWQSFSHPNEEGVNNRLALLLSEIERCTEEVLKAGGDTVVLAGDIFHVRGSVAPSVLNPTLDLFNKLRLKAKFIAIAGNHDLEGKNSNRVGSAITALEGVGVTVINNVSSGLMTNDDVIFLPWYESVDDLRREIESAKEITIGAKQLPSKVDLIIHAPIDGVIDGLPAHGLTPDWLSEIGFRRVFAGHYHNHKDFGNGVYSIGALAHHTWSDVGSKAGFLIVTETEVRRFKSRCPEFIDITSELSLEDAELLADGNYVRIKTESSKTSDIANLRSAFETFGAKGVVIQSVKTSTVERSSSVASSISAGASLEASLSDWVSAQSFIANKEAVSKMCLDILNEVSATEEE